MSYIITAHYCTW